MFEILAQAADENVPAADPFGQFQFFLPIIAIGILWYFLLLRPQRREQSRRDQLLKDLKKNDRVVSVGGILGTIANLSEKEVTLKVDDSTRIRLLRSSIQTVLTDESIEESQK